MLGQRRQRPISGLGGFALSGRTSIGKGVFIGAELGGLETFFANAGDDGIEQMCCLPGPTGQRRTIAIDLLRCHHLRLAVERQVVIPLVHDDMLVFVTGQTNRPRSIRLENRHRPWPSCHSNLTGVRVH